MAKELFINTCVLISIAFMANILFGKKIQYRKSRTLKTYMGIVAGLSSILLLFVPVTINGLNFGVEFIPIIASVFYGETLSGIISSSILIFAKILIPDIGDFSIFEYIAWVTICSFCGLVLKEVNQSFKTWIKMVGTFCLFKNIYIISLTNDLYNTIQSILLFDIVYILSSVLTYTVFVYMKKRNDYICELENDCEKDYLTGISNVRTFENALSQLNQDKLTKNVSLLLLDIDHFKLINDTYGHNTGDIVLKGFTDILKINCREFDSICRIGGEEFAIILRKCPRERASIVSQRIKDEVANHQFFTDKNKPINITVSIGISYYPETDIFQLKYRADSMLYKAKNSGRNRICS